MAHPIYQYTVCDAAQLEQLTYVKSFAPGNTDLFWADSHELATGLTKLNCIIYETERQNIMVPRELYTYIFVKIVLLLVPSCIESVSTWAAATVLLPVKSLI